MELKDFIGQVVISAKTKRRFVLEKITAPEIGVVTEEPGPSGYPQHYVYETINGDPFSRGLLLFEDLSLTAPFVAAYEAYSHTEDAYWENYDYWLHKSY